MFKIWPQFIRTTSIIFSEHPCPIPKQHQSFSERRHGSVGCSSAVTATVSLRVNVRQALSGTDDDAEPTPLRSGVATARDGAARALGNSSGMLATRTR